MLTWSYSRQNTNHGSSKLPDMPPKHTKMVQLDVSFDIVNGFDKRCPTKSIKGFALMPKDIRGSNILALLCWEIHDVSTSISRTTLKHFELQPGNGEPLLPIIPFDTVAHAFTPLNSCIFIYLFVDRKNKTKQNKKQKKKGNKHHTIKQRKLKQKNVCNLCLLIKLECRRKIASEEGRKSMDPRRLFILIWVFLINYINKSNILKHRPRWFESTWAGFYQLWSSFEPINLI